MIKATAPKPPNPRIVWSVTLCIVMFILAFITTIEKGMEDIGIIIFFCVIIAMVIGAIKEWRKYIDQSIDYKIHISQKSE